ncbi:MAG: hypothetical protein EOP45_20385 [Sphingobacteriaceae bacterium]|nr:MAG: hypothetical protein EOP45_20385 [Sphingobacteriaceae bacterium]
MKKMLLAILSCLYLVVTSGMQVQHHYCMGHLKATTVGFHENKKCGTCGMEAGSTACCHDESQWLKLNDKHQAVASIAYIPTSLALDIPSVYYFFLQPIVQHLVIQRASNNSPPPLLADRNVLYCVFRI